MLRSRSFAIALLATVLAGCASAPRIDLPAELVIAPTASTATAASEPRPAATSLRQIATPVPPGSSANIATPGAQAAEPPLTGPEISASLEGLPLPSFINEAFGNLLHLNFQVDPTLANRNDLVTLRLPSPQSPLEFYRLASQVLRAYGIATVWDGTLLRVVPAQQADSGEPPLFISGRALPDVPVSHRPIFQLVELQSVRSADVANWLRVAFPQQQDLKVEDDLNRNGVVLFGKPAMVRQAVAAIRVLDRPYMRGRQSTRLEPAFVGADELAKRLVDVLLAEGYAAATQLGPSVGTLVLPVSSANMVLVFSADAAVLAHVVDWARTIDRPNPSSSGDNLYYYQVKNTKAEDLVGILRSVASGMAAPASTPLAGASPTAAPAASPASTAVAGGRLAVDGPRNAILFQGGAPEWQRMLSLIEKMDRAARQVMVEVTIAEVTLDDGQDFGVSWFAKGGFDRFGGRLNFGTLPGTGSETGTGAGSGLTYLLDVFGQNRAALNAFAEDSRVSILSTPRLLVKSGEEASIDVGTEVPTITSQTTSDQQTDGDTALLQTIQYRKTGILLAIRPTVYSDDRIDIEISQEVSDALDVAAGAAVPSPAIFNRKVETSLSLRDGGSVLLGGLMSRRQTEGDSGIPFLKDVPVLGHLFKSQSRSNAKTELVLIIRPYIIETNEDAEAVTRAIGDQLEYIRLPEDAAAPGLAPALE